MCRFYGPILYTFVHYFDCCLPPADAPYKHQSLTTGVMCARPIHGGGGHCRLKLMQEFV